MEDRYVTSIAWQYGRTSSNVVVGCVDRPSLEGIDQYGAKMPLDSTKYEITNEDPEVASIVNYTTDWKRIDITGLKAGTTTATVKYNNGKSTKPSVTLPITVQKLGALSKISIPGKLYAQDPKLDENGNIVVNQWGQKEWNNGIEYDANNAYASEYGLALGIEAFDANNQKIVVPFDAFTWSVVSSDVKYDNGTKTVSTDAFKIVTEDPRRDNWGNGLAAKLITPDIVRDKEASGTITVKALDSANNLFTTIDIKISGKAPKAQSGTYMVYTKGYNQWNPADGLVTSSLDVKKSQKINIYAKDQYGHMVLNVDPATLKFKSKDEDIAVIAARNNTIYINTEEQVSTLVTVTVGDNVEIALTVNAKEKYDANYNVNSDAEIVVPVKTNISTEKNENNVVDITRYIPSGLESFSKVVVTGGRTEVPAGKEWGADLILFNCSKELIDAQDLSVAPWNLPAAITQYQLGEWQQNWGANLANSTKTFDTSNYSSGPLVVVNQNGSGVETGLEITEIVFLKTVQ